jgi:uncharacterized protein (DUF1330 family)
MKAYAIGSVQMRANSWVQEYVAQTEAIVAKHGGRYLVRGATMDKLEGDGALPHVMVVNEFPSMAHARARHSDPQYAPLIKLRQAGCDIDLVLVEGM